MNSGYQYTGSSARGHAGNTARSLVKQEVNESIHATVFHSRASFCKCTGFDDVCEMYAAATVCWSFVVKRGHGGVFHRACSLAGPTVSTRRVGIYALISSSGTQMMGPQYDFAVPYAECHTFLTGVGGQLTVCLIHTTAYLHLIHDQHLGERVVKAIGTATIMRAAPSQ